MVSQGIVVVDASSVSLVGRDGTVIKTVPFARTIAAAALDGTTLVVVDTTQLTVMSPALDILSTAPLVSTCVSAVVIGKLLVCGNGNDFQRIFDVYDVSQNPPIHVTASTTYSYDGLPMRRVPGANAFITVSDLSPPTFSLLILTPSTGAITYAGVSPFAAYPATTTIAFDTPSAFRMVQEDGDILDLTGQGCQGANTVIYKCFQQDGVVGTLRTGEYYLGLADDGAGKLVGIVGIQSSFVVGNPCAAGCPVQLIDIAGRSILRQQTYTLADLTSIVRTAYDPVLGQAVLGYAKMDYTPTVTQGYRVQELAFGSGGTGGMGGAAGGGGISAGGAGGGAGGAGGTSCGGTHILADSTNQLIDAFVTNAGVIVVDDRAVSLIGRDGQVIKSVPFAREITAAAFDGTHLIVADAAEITVMTAALDVGPSGPLVMSCGAATLMGENHFVCGPDTDSNRVFTTFDVGKNPPTLISTAATAYTYYGLPMTRVPGTDTYITEENGFYLFKVDAAAGTVTVQSRSLYTANEGTPLFAFDGTPPSHLVQGAGDILTIAPTDCQSAANSPQSCFGKTGTLGTLVTGQRYIGMGDDGNGNIFTLVSPTSATSAGSPCAAGCTVQKINVSSRTIAQQQTYTVTDLQAVVRTRYDSVCGSPVVAYTRLPAGTSSSSAGYRVQAFGF